MKTLIQVVIYLALVFFLASLTSCGEAQPEPKPTHNFVWRGKVLENGTITPVYMTLEQKLIYHADDTVWVNLATYHVDDTTENTMLVALETCSRLN